jgi:hypothetical protein
MAETVSAPPRAAPPRAQPTRSGSADKDVFAQIEKWMAIIREFSRQQPKS